MNFLCAVSFFFSSRRRHTRFDCDWSSDVCSSDLTCPKPSRILRLVSLMAWGMYISTTTCVDANWRRLDRRVLEFQPNVTPRSEERRVGKECRSGWSPSSYKEKTLQR